VTGVNDDDDYDNDDIRIHEVTRSMYPWIGVLSRDIWSSVIMTAWNAVHSCVIHAQDHRSSIR